MSCRSLVAVAFLAVGGLMLSGCDDSGKVTSVKAERVNGMIALKGKAAYLERMALPPHSSLVISIEEKDACTAGCRPVAERAMLAKGQVPLDFELQVNATALEVEKEYSIHVRLMVERHVRWENAPIVLDVTKAEQDLDTIILKRVSQEEPENATEAAESVESAN